MQKPIWLTPWFLVTLLLSAAGMALSAFYPPTRFALYVVSLVVLGLSVILMLSVRFPNTGPNMLPRALRASAQHSIYSALIASAMSCFLSISAPILIHTGLLDDVVSILFFMFCCVVSVYWAHLAAHERRRATEKLREAEEAQR